MTETPLDQAHAAMEAAADNDAARLRFYERLADSELFLLLESEPDGDQITPKIFPLDDGPVVLAFDRPERLTAFTDGPAPYAAMSGRSLCNLLNGNNISLGVNLEVAPSAILIPADALTWLSETLDTAPEETQATPTEISPPSTLPDVVIAALDTKLATARGLAHSAYLAQIRYETGQQTHLLAFIDPVPGAEDALAQAVSEALTFSGVEAGQLDVAFFRASDPITAKLARHGLRFDLPKAETITGLTPPGMDPDNPPILR
ncbi:SseB family protein [Actibacterium sp. 188UL27-1]|uniref:SseB family protein n=1 Tax=Actibacterium sp. 188UL27-1 TaxID=2786961 RepID=UPI00195A4438|nr:SseB family protein [Actibacterium sp. 188UL27-1]MBM7068093.1 SseB family protein [Actibacterium sp. 188UL27-1]